MAHGGGEAPVPGEVQGGRRGGGRPQRHDRPCRPDGHGQILRVVHFDELPFLFSFREAHTACSTAEVVTNAKEKHKLNVLSKLLFSHTIIQQTGVRPTSSETSSLYIALLNNCHVQDHTIKHMLPIAMFSWPP